MPNDNQFYDGYEEFIRNLQQDLENDSFDIYDNDDITILQEDSTTPTTSTTKEEEKDVTTHSNNPKSHNRNNYHKNNSKPYTNNNNNNYHKRKIPKYKRDRNDEKNNDLTLKINEPLITKLIMERSKAQRERNYEKADRILYDLNNIHHVYVWDKDRLWSVSPIAPSRRYNSNNNNNNGRNNYHQGKGRKGRTTTVTSGNQRFEPNKFGRNGHDYVQIGEEINPDICPLSLQEIHSLLSKRLEYKLIKQYHKADEIQSQLYTNGVRVHDKLKQWRGDGGIFADIEGMLSNKEYTINPYSEKVEDESMVQEITELVVDWAETRKKFDYKNADIMRQELWDIYRVAVDDKSRTWSKGGDFGPEGTFRWTDDGPINPRRDIERSKRDWREVGMYTKSKYSEELENHGEEEEEEIWNLVHDRLEARRVKDFDVADLIRDHLYKEYRVSVDDQLRQWSVGGEFDEEERRSVRTASPTTADGKMTSSFVRVYNQRGGNGHLSNKKVALVKAMIQRRSEEMARYNQKASESIRIGLKKKYYVIIDDVNCEWHVRGNDFILSPKLDMDSISEEVKAARTEIEALIRERSQAKGEGDFQRADEIRTDLYETYRIALDDRVKEWSVDITYDGDEFTSDIDDEVQNLGSDHDGPDDLDNSDDLESLSSLTVAKLRKKLKAAGLPVSGRKAELIDRLMKLT